VLRKKRPGLFFAIAAGALLHRSDDTSPGEFDASRTPSRAYLLVPLILGAITLRSTLQTAAYIVAGSGRSIARLSWAARIDPGS